MIKKTLANFKSCFVTGLVLLIPLALTFFAIRFLINFLTKPFLGYINQLLTQYAPIQFQEHPILLEIGAKTTILLTLVIFIFVLGLFTRIFFLQQFLKFWDHMINKIPLIKAFYKTTKDLLQTLFMSDKNAFKQVVMIKFPKDQTYVLGFIVKKAPEACNKASGLDLISVFIPTTPNPTSGYVVMVEKKDLHPVEIRSEEALTFILTCGAVAPCKKSS